MPSLRKPSLEKTRQFLATQATRELTYQRVGCTQESAPPGYVVEHYRIRLGTGADVFQAARSALESWRQLRLGWIEAYPSETPLRTGEVVALVTRVVGLWWLNACRIVYVIDEGNDVGAGREDRSGRMTRFGFAYGTLPAHGGSGEERFLIEWNRDDETVWYEVLSYSRAYFLVARLGYPLFRRIQKKFARASGQAMLHAAARLPTNT